MRLSYSYGLHLSLALTTLLGLAIFVSADGPPSSSLDNSARLLVSKQLMNKYIVEGMDVIISYSIYNVGSVAATDVHLVDNSFGTRDFQVFGQTDVNFGRIQPESNVTHTVVVLPMKFGYYNFTAAQVSYKSGESEEVIQGWSSEPGEGYIAPFREFDKRFSPHLLDWAAFAIMSLPPLIIPFMLWHSSKSKYEAVLLAKRR